MTDSVRRTLSTVILKPTRNCNADCTYCSAPPDGQPKWTLSSFRRLFDALFPRLHPAATFIWHGGEPMLLGEVFYREAHAYAASRLPHIRFSMQSNILSYGPRWNSLFRDVFRGSISTSWDPDETHRTLKGDPRLYSRLFHSRLAQVLADGWRPKVISTFDETTASLAHDVYERALHSSRRGLPYDIRLNYRYPAGRAAGEGVSILPATYGRTLLEIYDRWMQDAPDFLVTPLDQMLLRVVSAETGRCPWVRGCTGRIIAIEPNFDVYNCGEFADLGDASYRFGNLLDDGIDACLSSAAARSLAARTVRHPADCRSCEHFAECEGGCMRDSVLFDRGPYGKFQYCESWKMVFARLKESVVSGEADRILERLGCDVDRARRAVARGARPGPANTAEVAAP